MVVQVAQSLDLMLMKGLVKKTGDIVAGKKVNMNMESRAVENI